jgi:ATP-dependent DNA helicase RecG
MQGFFDTKIEFLKGVGPAKAELLNKELQIFTFGDLIQHYPFRHEDRTKFHKVKEIQESMSFIQLNGTINRMEMIGSRTEKKAGGSFC